MKSLISVIIAVYNSELFLNRCIDSVLAQTYSNLEIILVNDGSTDSSKKICDEYVLKDSRIHLINKENGGVSSARNAGLQIATGEYIAFVDSDDYIMPDMYQKMLNCIVEQQVDVAVCQWQYETNEGIYSVSADSIDEAIYGRKNSMLFERFLSMGGYENGVVCAPWNKLYKRAVIDGIEFEGLQNEDEHFNDRIFANNCSIFVLKEFLYVYCQNNESLTNQQFNAKKLCFLDVLIQRTALFSSDDIIVGDTMKLYCEMYVEYYLNAIQMDIFVEKKYYIFFKKALKYIHKMENRSLKTLLRLDIFLISKSAYKKLVFR